MSVLRDTAVLHRMIRYRAEDEIMGCVGDLSSIGRLYGNQMLLGTYVHSGLLWNDRIFDFPMEERLSLEALYELYESGKGFLNQQAALESVHQGKVHLVLAMGEDMGNAEGRHHIGQWVWTLPENTRGMNIQCPGAKKSRLLEKLGVPNYTAGWPCKIAYASDLYGDLPHQDVLV